MKTEKEILKIYKEEKEVFDKDVYYLGNEDQKLILQGWIEALEYILEIK
jgi:hypothetical protein|tara:strand:- start:2799 stop:2945 length:147 start_codon:yes stop_codon:yes gene_type:complete